jgi:glutathione S-transferase
MTLYCKAGPDGTLLGDCPFAQYVRLVLEEKGLEYELQPTVQDTKPVWLVEYYNGKLPALRHGKECYVEADVIAVAGLFPATAKYLKHTPDGDADDAELLEVLETKLAALEQHLQRSEERTGPFLVGDGTAVTLVDCSLVPKLYHLQTGVTAFKGQIVADKLVAEYPALQSYMNTMFERSSFQKTVYPKETVAWGWGNARN